MEISFEFFSLCLLSPCRVFSFQAFDNSTGQSQRKGYPVFVEATDNLAVSCDEHANNFSSCERIGM